MVLKVADRNDDVDVIMVLFQLVMSSKYKKLKFAVVGNSVKAHLHSPLRLRDICLTLSSSIL